MQIIENRKTSFCLRSLDLVSKQFVRAILRAPRLRFRL
jgi:hypothetical protein